MANANLVLIEDNMPSSLEVSIVRRHNTTSEVGETADVFADRL